MRRLKYKYIYGPIPSWRLGRSLGIDLLSQKKKICSFDCVYCQLGRARPHVAKRKIYVPTKEILKELSQLPKVTIDYITFSGRGEPTLAKNLGQTITAIKKIRKEPIAVLTNASVMDRKDVRQELTRADFVMIKLDACSQAILTKINNPLNTIKLIKIINGLKLFRLQYQGILALQIMFIKENKAYAARIAQLAKQIGADEIQLNTPTRPCWCKPLGRSEIKIIKKLFLAKSVNVISVYESRKKKTKSLSARDTLLRRGRV